MYSNILDTLFFASSFCSLYSLNEITMASDTLFASQAYYFRFALFATVKGGQTAWRTKFVI